MKVKFDNFIFKLASMKLKSGIQKKRKIMELRIGTIGTGPIVTAILNSVEKTDGISCGAVYSRTEESGRKMADQYGVEKVYTSLPEMLADPELNFVYIASPNSLHYAQAKLALEAGKNVICEKPFTSTAKEAAKLITIAKEKKLFLFEGITTMYLPNYQILKEKLPEIGKVRMVQCDYCQFSSRYPALLEGRNPNVFNPEFSGGSFMDINLYNIYLVLGLFGTPEEADYYPNFYKNGIDTSGTIVMRYPEFICECTGAKDCFGVNSVQIQGEQGTLYVTDGSNGLKEIRLLRKDSEEIFNMQEGKNQWLLEVEGLTRVVLNEDYEDCYRRLAKTVEVVAFMEKTRRGAGIIFPADSE